MFFEWLEKQRNRPEGERLTLAIVMAGVLTGLLVVAWLPARAVLERGEAAVRVSDVESPWADKQDELSGVLSQFREQFTELQDSARILQEAATASTSEDSETKQADIGGSATTTATTTGGEPR